MSSCRRAFSMIEIVFSIAIVGTLTAAVMSLVGSAGREMLAASESAEAALLVDALLEEIATKPISAEPVANQAEVDLVGSVVEIVRGIDVFEAEPDRSSVITRTSFTTIASYDGWSSTPPVDAEGRDVPNMQRWTRTVSVIEVDRDTPDSGERLGTGVYKITVTASIGSKDVLSHSILRVAQSEGAYP